MLVPFGTHVLDKDGKSVGTVSRLVLHPESREVTAIVVHQGIVNVIVRRGVIFRRETAIPASVIASVGDRITLSVGADEVKKLERPLVGEPGPAHSR